MKIIQCPKCKGKGSHPIRNFGNAIAFYLPCLTCQGSGQVQESELEQISDNRIGIVPKQNSDGKTPDNR